MSMVEHTTRWLCPVHPAIAVERPESGDRCLDCNGPLVETAFVVVPAAEYEEALSLLNQAIPSYSISRGAWWVRADAFLARHQKEPAALPFPRQELATEDHDGR